MINDIQKNNIDINNNSETKKETEENNWIKSLIISIIKLQLTEKEPDVTKEDQQYINEFSRLYTKNKLVDKELKELKVKNKFI